MQTSTGFGFSIMATPFLLLLFLPEEAVQINIILSILISIALIWKIKKDIDFVILKRFSLGSILGVPFGILLLTVNVDVLKLLISSCLLLLTLLLMCNLMIKRSRIRDYIVGAISGVLTTSIGMPGPPLLLYFTGTGVKKEKIRATTLAFFIFIYFISLVTQIFYTGTNKIIWQSSLFAIPIVIAGMFLGQFMFRLLTQKTFKIFTYILLLCTGSYLFIVSLNSLL